MQLRLWGLLVTGPPPISQNRILCVMQKALWLKFWPFDFLVHEFPKRHVSVPSASQWLREAVDLSVHLSIPGAAQAAECLGIVLDNTHGALRARSVPQGQWDGPVFRAEVDFGSTIPFVSIHCVLRHSLRATKVTRIKRQHQTYPRGGSSVPG